MTALCPICRKKEMVERFKPFCSKRCSDVDLNRWLTGQYALPTDEVAPDGPSVMERPEAAND